GQVEVVVGGALGGDAAGQADGGGFGDRAGAVAEFDGGGHAVDGGVGGAEGELEVVGVHPQQASGVSSFGEVGTGVVGASGAGLDHRGLQVQAAVHAELARRHAAGGYVQGAPRVVQDTESGAVEAQRS